MAKAKTDAKPEPKRRPDFDVFVVDTGGEDEKDQKSGYWTNRRSIVNQDGEGCIGELVAI